MSPFSKILWWLSIFSLHIRLNSLRRVHPICVHPFQDLVHWPGNHNRKSTAPLLSCQFWFLHWWVLTTFFPILHCSFVSLPPISQLLMKFLAFFGEHQPELYSFREVDQNNERRCVSYPGRCLFATGTQKVLLYTQLVISYSLSFFFLNRI